MKGDTLKNKPRFVTGVLLALLAGGIFTLNARHEQKNAKVSRAESKDSIPLVSIQKTIVGMPSSKHPFRQLRVARRFL